MHGKGDFFVWVQATTRRDYSPTLASIEASDIGKNYHLHLDPSERVFPRDYAALQQWWYDAMLEMCLAAHSNDQSWMLRLEDDIIVNESILHNIYTWPALDDPLFGFGTLFHPDYWDSAPKIFASSPFSKEKYRNTKDVEGAQAQVFHVDTLLQILPFVKEAICSRGLGRPQDPPSFDWGLSRAAFMLGCRQKYRKQVFVHSPGLVNLRDCSRSSTLTAQTKPQTVSEHYWSHKNFNPTWRRTT